MEPSKFEQTLLDAGYTYEEILEVMKHIIAIYDDEEPPEHALSIERMCWALMQWARRNL